MISECEIRDNCRMNIASPDFIQKKNLRGYLETPRQRSSRLKGLKKNSMWLMRHGSPEPLRQDSAPDSGFILRGCANISGSGGPASHLSEVQESEAGKTGLYCWQSILHKALCPLCRPKVSCNDHTGCCKRTQTGLAYSQGAGQRIH